MEKIALCRKIVEQINAKSNTTNGFELFIRKNQFPTPDARIMRLKIDQRTRKLWIRNTKCENKIKSRKILRIKLRFWKWYSRNEYKSARICDVANNCRGLTQSTMQRAISNVQHFYMIFKYKHWTLYTLIVFMNVIILIDLLDQNIIHFAYQYRIQWFCLQYLNIYLLNEIHLFTICCHHYYHWIEYMKWTTWILIIIKFAKLENVFKFQGFKI